MQCIYTHTIIALHSNNTIMRKLQLVTLFKEPTVIQHISRALQRSSIAHSTRNSVTTHLLINTDPRIAEGDNY